MTKSILSPQDIKYFHGLERLRAFSGQSRAEFIQMHYEFALDLLKEDTMNLMHEINQPIE